MREVGFGFAQDFDDRRAIGARKPRVSLAGDFAR
jgi:hypothetical protein